MSLPAYCIYEQISDEKTGITLCLSENCFNANKPDSNATVDSSLLSFDKILTYILKYDGPITLLPKY